MKRMTSLMSCASLACALTLTLACTDDGGADEDNETTGDGDGDGDGDPTGDGDGDPTGDGDGDPTSGDPCADGGEIIGVSEDINEDTTWSTCNTYVLEDYIYVNGSTLTVDPGTQIRGLNGSALIIEKDAMIMAKGTADAPIVFTSNNIDDSPARGDWGGLVLLGDAPTNIGTGQAEGFPVPPTYGGDNAAHNCGTLEYVRVEYAGFALSDGNELNGITFYACGTETTVGWVQSHMGLDDGIEMFGGEFNAHHIVVTGAADDSLDTDQGYTGLLDFVFIHQDPAVGDNCFEVSNQGSDFSAEPKTTPDVCNATCVGSGVTGEKSKGVTIKEGTHGYWSSSIFVTTTNEATLLADDATADEALDGNIDFQGNIFFANGDPEHQSNSMTIPQADWQAWIEDAERANASDDPGLASAAWGSPNIVPAGDVSEVAGPCEFGYIGAVDPAGEDWTQASWINYTP